MTARALRSGNLGAFVLWNSTNEHVRAAYSQHEPGEPISMKMDW